MTIAIFGAGRIGGRLARAWRGAGHDVVLGVRNTGEAGVRALVEETGARAQSIDEAARAGAVFVLAVPYAALEGLLPALAPHAEGKLVIDSTNALAPGHVLRFPPTTSAAEETARALPGARVVKAFNTQGAEIISNPAYGGIPASNFFCGDDPEAKRLAARLIADIGFEPVDLGPLQNARMLESLTIVWFAATAACGTRDVAFKLLRR